MKKTITISLADKVFHTEEDAYRMLEQHFSVMRENKTYDMAAVENYASDFFQSKKLLVITSDSVKELLPALKEKFPFSDTAKNQKKKLYRDKKGGVLGGVFAGFAYYFGMDATLFRILFTILLIFLSGPLFFLFYVLCCIIIPAAKTEQERLQMKGLPETEENMNAERMLLNENNTNNRGCFVILLIGMLFLIFSPILLLILLFSIIEFFPGFAIPLDTITFRNPISFTGTDTELVLLITFGILAVILPFVTLIFNSIQKKKGKIFPEKLKWIMLICLIITVTIVILLISKSYVADFSNISPVLINPDFNWDPNTI